MKNKVLAIVLANCIAGTASAQMVFQSGSIDFSIDSFDFDSEFFELEFGGRADYDIGGLGLQLDGAMTSLTDFESSTETYTIAAHLYKPLNNGTKIGGYVGIDIIDLVVVTEQLYNFGVEGIIRVGPVEIEAALGGFYFDGAFEDFWRTEVNIYYEISPAFEVSIGVDHMFDSDFSDTSYSASAVYQMSNLPISIGAEYQSFDGFETFGVSISYKFGDPNGERLFQTRGIPFLSEI